VRPVLKPALRRIWRDDTTLQLGADPARALLLRGLDPPLAGTLRLLDGSRRAQDVVADAECAGVAPAATTGLLELLAAGSALDDAGGAVPTAADGDRERLVPDRASLSLLAPRPGEADAALGRRYASRVLVRGGGRVGGTLALLLGAAGVRVAVEDDEPACPADLAPGGLVRADLGAARGGALQRRLPAPAPRGRPHLVLLAPPGPGAVPPGQAAALAAAGVPHLVAAVRETTGVVGPLVLPGITGCLRCVDLHRAERDPGWPLVAAQLAAGGRGGTDACDTALATVVAGVAALQVLAFLDAAPGAPPPATAGGTLELALPDWRLRRRSWPVHPCCSCADREA